MTRLRAFALGIFVGWRACQFMVYWALRAARRRELADQLKGVASIARVFRGDPRGHQS